MGGKMAYRLRTLSWRDVALTFAAALCLWGVQAAEPTQALPVRQTDPPGTELATTPIKSLSAMANGALNSAQVRVQGVVTLVYNSNTLFIADPPPDLSSDLTIEEPTGLRIQVKDSSGLQRGDRVDLTGLLAGSQNAPFLADAVLRKVGTNSLPRAVDCDPTTVLSRASHGVRVQMSGRLIDISQHQEELVFLLEDRSRLFDVRLARWSASARPELLGGVQLTVEGICSLKTDASGVPRGFQILIESYDDLQLGGPPSLWNSPSILGLSAALFFALLLVALVALLSQVWVVSLRRRVARQTEIVKRQLIKEAALEAKYRQMIENAQDMIFTLNDRGELTSVNPAGERITGYPPEALLGKSFTGLVAAEDRANAEALWAPGHNMEAASTIEMGLVARNGRRIILEISTRPVLQEGRMIGIEGIGRDITQRKEAEQALRHAQKMEAIGQLSAGVAHDFNNLLTVIMGNLDLLELRDPNLSPSGEGHLAQIKDAAERASGLTRQLLLFSRPQNAQLKAVDLNELLRNLMKMLGRLIGEHIQLDCQCESGLPRVIADPGMLEQVVLNLAVNARDAMPNGGSLTLTTAEAHLEAAQEPLPGEARPGWFVRLQVTDTGCGMDEATCRRIFEPFFTTKEPGKGTGLGLATVSNILKQHQGWIEVTSQPGRGTTFSVFLPAQATSPASQTPDAVAAVVPGGQETVLVVEDEAAVRDVLCHTLRHHGYRVLAARTGPEAMRIWSEYPQPIHLLFADMVLPGGLTGSELARRLQEQSPRLKVILTSGYSPEPRPDNLEAARPSRFMQKPYTSEQVLRVVRECLDESEKPAG